MSTLNCSPTALHYSSFAIVVAGRTLYGRAYATVLRLSVVCNVIVVKRCVLEKKLLLAAYRKSYMRFICTKRNDIDLF